MMHDALSNALSAINNAEKVGKNEIAIRPSSKVIAAVLNIFKKEGYIKEAEIIKNNRGGMIKLELAGQINKVGAIKPRFPITLTEYEKFEKRYLPAKDFGRLIVSTSKGIFTHIEAKEKNLGGVLLAYVY